MNENLRLVVIILIMGTVGAFLWMWTNRESTPSPESPATQQVANSVPAPAEPIAVEEDKSIETAKPETDHVESELEKETGKQKNASKNSKTGPGVIKGTLTMRDKSDLPQDIYTIHLHRIEEKMSTKEIKDTLVDTFETQSDGTFEIKKLPLGQYIMIAYSEYLTGNSSSTLVKERKESERTIQMAPKGFLSGVVVNPQGEIIPAANVFVGGYKQNDNLIKVGELRSRGSRALTNDSGEFSIGSLQVQTPPLTYQLMALADGYAPTVSDLFPVNSTGIQIVMQKGVPLAGKVVEADTDEPRSNFAFSLSSGYALNRLDAKTNEDGSFAFADVAPADYTVVLESKAEVISDDTRTVKVIAESDNTDALIKVMMGGRIAGRLTDADTGQGIANAQMSGYPQDIPNTQTQRVETDSQGNYVLEGLLTGDYRVQYRDVKGYPDRSYDSRKNIGVTIGQTVSDINFELSRGTTISGRVTLEDGSPVKDASVSANASQVNVYDNDRTDDHGRFVVAGFSPGQSIRMTAQKTGFGMVRLDSFKLPEEPKNDIEIMLQVESTISGTVVDGSGSPVKGLRLFTHDTAQTEMNIYMNEPSATGDFKMSRLTAGTFEIHYYNNRFDQTQKPLGTFTLDAGEHLTDVQLIYDLDPGLTIEGTVKDEDGQLVRYTQVNASGAGYSYTQTDNEGKFILANLTEGNYSLSFHSGSHSTKTMADISAGTKNLEVVLEKRGTVKGTVLDAVTNAPVTEFQIQARRSSQQFQPHMNQNYKNYQNADGTFSINNVEGGSNIIMAKAPGYSLSEVTVDHVPPGETVENIVIRLAGGARLTGTVQNQDAEPIHNALIFDGVVPRYNHERSAGTKTDRQGKFILDSLPVGNATIGIYHEMYRQEQTNVTLNSGRNNTVTVTLYQGGTVEGYVTAGGKPQKGSYVSYNARNMNRQAQTDEDGYYQLSGLPDGPGNINSRVTVDRARRSKNLPVEIANGMTTKLNIDYAAANSVVEGVLLKAENTPADGQLNLSLTLTDGSSEHRNTETDSEGYFIFESLPAGSAQLHVNIPGHSAKMIPLEIGDNESIWKDVELFGGSTINVQLFNNPESTFPVSVLALSGHTTLPNPLTMESYQELLTGGIMANARVVNDQCTMTNLDPGQYTLFAAAYTQQPSQENPFEGILWATKQVTIEKNKIHNFEMTFE
jgi:hypothetical protein